ncbi:TPA_exp: hypothetical protein A8136_3169 [Trichophyton benhamiae CBS 112371]|nr:TPA_exp: hypothetical protein A8136_3169 [Trichophyton benhamiae CBS 112371]
MALNRVGDDNLYIGGPGPLDNASQQQVMSHPPCILHTANQNILYYRVYASRLMALNNKLALERENITHTLTVLRINVDEERFKRFKEHLHIPVDDVDDEDLLQHFPTTNAFIRSGLESGTGGVLVHCAMGKSRSATVCIAYLLHKDPGALTPREALDLIRRTRPLCEPNDGFMEQLELYHQMGCPDNVVDHPVYQRWLYQRAVQDSVACGKGPELNEIHFEDQGISNNSIGDFKEPVDRTETATRNTTIHHPAYPRKQKRLVPNATPCPHIIIDSHVITAVNMRPHLPPPTHLDASITFPVILVSNVI